MAGLKPAVSTAFGNDGAAIAPPVAEAPLPDFGGVEGIVQGNGKPATPVTPPLSEMDMLDADMAAFDQGLSALDAELGGGEMPMEAGPDDMSPLPAPEGAASLKEQFSESVARMKNAFAVTGPESLDVLKKSGLFDDVRDQGGTIQVKRKGRKGWENFDRDKWELIGDTLDFARDGVEALIENGGRIGGAITGALVAAPEGALVGAGAGTLVAPGPGTVAGGVGGGVAAGLAGAVPGGIAGGAGGAVIAKNVGDAIAEYVMGIKQDPERNKTQESVVAGAMGAGFSWLGSRMARNRAAKDAAKREATKTLEYAKEQVTRTTEDIAEVAKSFQMDKKTGRIRLDPQQAVGPGVIPELDVTARELSTEQSFRNFRREAGDSIKSAYDSVAHALGAAAGRGAEVGDDFILTAKDVRKVEGKYIEAFRTQAESQLKGVSQPAPVTLNTLQMISQNIKTAGHAERQLGLTPAQAKNYMRETDVIKRLLTRTKGNMKIDTAFALEKRLTQAINANMDNPNGRAYAIALLDVRNAIKDDALDMMEQSFIKMGDKDGTLLKAFQASKGRYKELIGATGNLGNLLKTENISKNELVAKLFEGKGSYKFAMNAKTLINETDPKLWNQLSGEYFLKLRNDATDALDNNVNWPQMEKKWRDLDPRLKKELMTASGMRPEGMEALLRLGTRVKNANFDAMPRESQKGFIKRNIKMLAVYLGGGATARGAAVGQTMVEGMGKDQAMMKWLKDGGMEEILNEMPGLKPERAAGLREWVTKWSPAPKALGATTSRRKGQEALAAPTAVPAEEPEQ